MVAGWLPVSRWLVATWSLVGRRLVTGWLLVNHWLVVGWLLVGWLPIGGWLVAGGSAVDCPVVIGWFPDGDQFLISRWLVAGYSSVSSILHTGFLLLAPLLLASFSLVARHFFSGHHINQKPLHLEFSRYLEFFFLKII